MFKIHSNFSGLSQHLHHFLEPPPRVNILKVLFFLFARVDRLGVILQVLLLDFKGFYLNLVGMLKFVLPQIHSLGK